ncbi:MAG: hypothetical protein QOJ69_99 [Actinomycetota bacterium]|nr:hypothetical protein [Actinomycetota bacterium]
MSRRPLAVGLGLGGLYAVVAVATLLLADRPLLPLFDGLAPPPPYRWVKPPPETAADTQPRAAPDREAPLGPEGSPFLNVTPEDGQAVVVLEVGAVAPNPPETAVRVAVTPHDAGTLAGLPDGLTPVSNAYQVVVTYQPSAAPVPTLRDTPASSVALTAAGFSDVMLYSPDGKGWTRRPDPEPLLGGHGLRTTLAAPGYFVVASIDRSPGGGGTSPLVLTLLLSVPVVVVVVLVVVKKRRDADRARAKADARKRGGRGPAARPSKRRPPPPGRPGRRSG